MGYAYEMLGRYKQKVVDESELNATAKNLEKALQTGNYKKYGWGAVEKPLAGYKFSSEVEKTHFLEQVKLMLKLWGTGPIGKNTVSAIVEKCLAANDNLQNVGAYARGTEIKDAKGKKIGEVKDTNPVVVWIGEYRRKNDLGITQETVAAKVEAGAAKEREALRKKTPEKTKTIAEEEVGKAEAETGVEESEGKEPRKKTKEKEENEPEKTEKYEPRKEKGATKANKSPETTVTQKLNFEDAFAKLELNDVIPEDQREQVAETHKIKETSSIGQETWGDYKQFILEHYKDEKNKEEKDRVVQNYVGLACREPEGLWGWTRISFISYVIAKEGKLDPKENMNDIIDIRDGFAIQMMG